MEQHFPFLFWAYNIIWLLFAGYLVTLGVRQRSISKQIRRLSDEIDRESRG